MTREEEATINRLLADNEHLRNMLDWQIEETARLRSIVDLQAEEMARLNKDVEFLDGQVGRLQDMLHVALGEKE